MEYTFVHVTPHFQVEVWSAEGKESGFVDLNEYLKFVGEQGWEFASIASTNPESEKQGYVLFLSFPMPNPPPLENLLIFPVPNPPPSKGEDRYPVPVPPP